jgi:hypothetical protein
MIEDGASENFPAVSKNSPEQGKESIESEPDAHVQEVESCDIDCEEREKNDVVFAPFLSKVQADDMELIPATDTFFPPK